MYKPCVLNYLLILHSPIYPPLSLSIPKSPWTNNLIETFISNFCIQISHGNNHFMMFTLVFSTLHFSIEFIHFIFFVWCCWDINIPFILTRRNLFDTAQYPIMHFATDSVSIIPTPLYVVSSFAY